MGPVQRAAPASADGDRLRWPLRPHPPVVRVFDAPTPNWQRGHRGVDLA
ncbi:peptidase M23, partial [Mycobacterium sp. ITM-2017-0098]